MATDYGYLIPKDNYGKSSNADRYKKIAQQASLPKQTTTEKMDDLWVGSTAPNALEKKNVGITVNTQDKFNSRLQPAVKQDLGGKIGNFFKVTLPNAAEDLWDDIKEPFVGKSEKQLLTEAKLSPKLLVEDAKIQLAKENPTREDYALVKQTQDVIKKYGTPESNIRAISEDTTQLQKDLERAEKTYQASPIDATFANIGAAGAGIISDVAGFTNMLGADKIPVIKDINNAIISTAEVLQDNAQDYNVGTYGGYLGNLTQVITRMVPYFIAGTGKAVATGSKAALMAAKTIQNPSFWVSLITTAGQKYNENMNNGISRGTATLNALTTALPSALIEIGGGIGAQGKEAQSLLRTIFEENLEEIAQGLVENVSDKLTTKKRYAYIFNNRGSNNKS